MSLRLFCYAGTARTNNLLAEWFYQHPTMMDCFKLSLREPVRRQWNNNKERRPSHSFLSLGIFVTGPFGFYTAILRGIKCWRSLDQSVFVFPKWFTSCFFFLHQCMMICLFYFNNEEIGSSKADKLTSQQNENKDINNLSSPSPSSSRMYRSLVLSLKLIIQHKTRSNLASNQPLHHYCHYPIHILITTQPKHLTL